ncbi:MAG: hypothetical protein V4805_03730 [Pseudomonadota bacterium]
MASIVVAVAGVFMALAYQERVTMPKPVIAFEIIFHNIYLWGYMPKHSLFRTFLKRL